MLDAVHLTVTDVQPRYPHCMIRMARFKGKDKLGDFIDNQRIDGNAFRLINAASDFCQRHLPIASFFVPTQMQRIDQPAVPALALREALVNAVIHRDYTNRSSSIALAIFDDRLEIWNNGILPPQLKATDLRGPHQSYLRNEVLANMFYKRGWIEGWGTGTTRMIGYCQQNGTPEPEFNEYSGGFSVLFRLKNQMESSIEKVRISLPNLTSRQEEIMKIMSSNDKMSILEISNLLQENIVVRTLRRDLVHLKHLGLIEVEGSTNRARWFVKDKLRTN